METNYVNGQRTTTGIEISEQGTPVNTCAIVKSHTTMAKWDVDYLSLPKAQKEKRSAGSQKLHAMERAKQFQDDLYADSKALLL